MVSPVWSLFIKESKSFAKCKQCTTKIKLCGNTTNLRKHIVSKHPHLSAILTSDVDQNQLKIDESLATIQSFKDGDRARVIEMQLVWFIVSNFQPFSIVESAAFRAFVKLLSSNFTVPSRRKIVNLIVELFNSKKDLVKSHLKTIDWIAITCDLWTDELNSRSYIGATCHYIDDYKCVSLCLAVKQMTVNHTGENIYAALNDVFEDYEIDKEKIVTIISDGAANMLNASNKIVNQPVWCIAHRINLLVNDSLEEIESVGQLLSKVRAIVKLFKQSNKFCDALNNMQLNEGVNPLKPCQDVVTRWNSSFLMLQRFIEIRRFISMALIKIGKESMDISHRDTDILIDIKSLLEPFYDVTEDISGEKYVTISRIIPVINMAKHKLINIKTKSETGHIFQGILCKHIDKRFGKIEEDECFAYATMLDPRFKRVDFMSPLACSQTINSINNMMRIVPLTQPETVSVEREGLWSLHERRCQQITGEASGLNVGFKHYLAMSNLGLNDDPLEFWKRNKDNWHELHNLALKYLTPPATSVPCERLFSKTGNIITEKRSRLKPKNVEMICFLQSLPDCFKV